MKRVQLSNAERIQLVLDNLGDSAHGALLDAVTASDASILAHNLSDPIDNLENLLRASINADAATDAIVSLNDRM